MKRSAFSIIVALVICFAPAWSFAVLVPGTSDPWLAGMPDGSSASLGDSAPAQSPVLVPALDLSAAGYLSFRTTGAVSNGSCCAPQGPDGGEFISHDTGPENGISSVTAPINALVGVFLDVTRPDNLPAPGSLDFSTIRLDFASFAPALRQVFFIGDGLTGTGAGVAQNFVIPSGATRLYLGTMDGFEWSNNLGLFEVIATHSISPIPEPSMYILLACGIVVLCLSQASRGQARAWPLCSQI